MKIIALVKHSMDVAEIRVDPATKALKTTAAPRRFGDLDKGVVEAAVQLKESTGAEVEILCFGPPAATAAVKDLLAMGADSATVVADPFEGEADGATVARILQAALEKLSPFDLVLCGFASDDGYSFQTGPRLAERLGLPLVSYACSISVDSGMLVAERDLESVIQTVRAALPAVVTVAEEAFMARSVTLLQAMKAQKKPAQAWALGDLGLDRAELEQGFSYVSLGETGVIVSRRQKVLRGSDMGDLADELIDDLVDVGILDVQGGQ